MSVGSAVDCVVGAWTTSGAGVATELVVDVGFVVVVVVVVNFVVVASSNLSKLSSVVDDPCVVDPVVDVVVRVDADAVVVSSKPS